MQRDASRGAPAAAPIVLATNVLWQSCSSPAYTVSNRALDDTLVSCMTAHASAQQQLWCLAHLTPAATWLAFHAWLCICRQDLYSCTAAGVLATLMMWTLGLCCCWCLHLSNCLPACRCAVGAVTLYSQWVDGLMAEPLASCSHHCFNSRCRTANGSAVLLVGACPWLVMAAAYVVC